MMCASTPLLSFSTNSTHIDIFIPQKTKHHFIIQLKYNVSRFCVVLYLNSHGRFTLTNGSIFYPFFPSNHMNNMFTLARLFIRILSISACQSFDKTVSAGTI
jgi:hypothetical protein